jgi:hypothetical protein
LVILAKTRFYLAEGITFFKIAFLILQGEKGNKHCSQRSEKLLQHATLTLITIYTRASDSKEVKRSKNSKH